MRMILHNFFRSSTSTRVRIALNYKQLEYEYVSYALRAREHLAEDYLRRNPQGLVPTLELEDGTHLTQSLAIVEWLEETFPEPPLLPQDALSRCRVRALAYSIACDIHPLNNLRVLQRLEGEFGTDETAIKEWFCHWVEATFEPLENILANHPETGDFCHGNTPTLADLCLYAQIHNNKRFDIDTAPYPTINRIFKACDELDAFSRAAPMNQPDAPSG